MAEENTEGSNENIVDNSSEPANEKKPGKENLRVLENIDVALTVEVGGAEIKIKELLRLGEGSVVAVSYTHLRAHETSLHLVCRLLLEKKNTIR